MGRHQVGLRISEGALAKVDTLANEYKTTRADVLRALLAEAFASQAVITAARKRLERVDP